MTQATETVHATSVAVDGKGILIIGPSGSGKSSLALQLIALGAGLIADDRTQVKRDGGTLIASVPPAIAGLIEARGVGLLQSEPTAPTQLCLVIDLSLTEQQRLPEIHAHELLGITLPCLNNAHSPHFAAAVWLYANTALHMHP